MNFGLYAKFRTLDSKAKDDVGSKEQAFVVMAKRKGKFGKFGPQGKGKTNIFQSPALATKNMDIIRRIVLSSRKTIIRENEKKPTLPKK